MQDLCFDFFKLLILKKMHNANYASILLLCVFLSYLTQLFSMLLFSNFYTIFISQVIRAVGEGRFAAVSVPGIMVKRLWFICQQVEVKQKFSYFNTFCNVIYFYQQLSVPHSALPQVSSSRPYPSRSQIPSRHSLPQVSAEDGSGAAFLPDDLVDDAQELLAFAASSDAAPVYARPSRDADAPVSAG